jgi:hypothetical protein
MNNQYEIFSDNDHDQEQQNEAGSSEKSDGGQVVLRWLYGPPPVHVLERCRRITELSKKAKQFNHSENDNRIDTAPESNKEITSTADQQNS